MNMKIVKGLPLDLIRMCMALPVVTSQPEVLRGVPWAESKYDREIQRIEYTLPQDQTKLGAECSGHIKLSFFVPSLRF